MNVRCAAALAALFAAPLPAAEGPSRLELVSTIRLAGKAGRLDHLALDGKGKRLFVANLSNDTLDVVDLEAGKLLRQLTGQKKAQGVAYVPGLNRVFVGCGASGACNVFDGATFRLLKSFPLPDADNVRTHAGLVYVSHEKALTVLDARTLERKATIPLPGPPEAFQIDAGRKRLYVNVTSPPQVASIDLGKHEVVARYPLTLARANYPMALDTKKGHVFVGSRKPPRVVAVDAATGKELYAVAIPGDCDDLFHDARRDRLYAICGEGFVAILERDGSGKFRVAEKLATAKLARTGLFDPETARLFVVLPRASAREDPVVRVYRVGADRGK
jgi:DNA-binding beta-propeller fold protein YncE